MTFEQVWPLLLIVPLVLGTILASSRSRTGDRSAIQCLWDSAPASFLPPRFCASKIDHGRRGACPSFDRPIGHRSEERKGSHLDYRDNSWNAT
jgi:hypothetical protein